MTKNNNLSSLLFSFLSLVVLLPFFISIDVNNIISFDRSVWVFGEFQNGIDSINPKTYLITFPFSLIIVSFLGIKYFSNIVVNKIYQYTVGWTLFVLIINLAFGDFSVMFIKIIGGMFVFSTSILVFDEYFSRVKLRISSVKESVNLEGFYILKPFIIISLLLFASYIVYMDDTLIVPWLRIYNFDQYLAYALFLFIGAFFRYKWRLLYAFIVVTFFAYISRNKGIEIMLLLLFVAYLIYVTNLTWLKKYSVNLMKIAILCVIVYQLLSYFLPNIKDIAPFSLSLRMEIIYSYFTNISSNGFKNLIFPLHEDVSIIEYLHNEILQILSVVGLLGVFLHYMVTYSRIKIIFMSNIGIAISISIVIVIGGVLVLPTIHSYTGILIAYLISFYSTIGCHSNS